jgi:hypothetical protein
MIRFAVKRWDQPVSDSPETDQEPGGKYGRHDDSVRVHEPAAAVSETAGKEPVVGDDAAETRKVGKAGVG